MQSQVDQISPVVVEVRVEVPWTKVNENLEGAYRNLQRTARVRGFRPGKVPRHVVKSLMGKSVEREVATRLMEESLAEAVKEHSLDPVAMASVDSPILAEGQPLNFKAKLEVRPKIDSVNTSELKVERTPAAVTEAEIDQEIQRLREQNGELVTPDPARPARAGDTLTLKIDVSVEGQPRSDLSSDDTQTVLGSERLLNEIDEGLKGVQVGEEKEIALTFPEDYGHEPLRGKAASFKVKVKEMREKVLPELDDEFARDLEHESLAALRADVEKRLREVAQRRSDAELRELVVDKLIDTNPVPVPPSLIERQEQAMLEELQQLQQMLGRPLPWGGAMQEEMQKRAERKIRAGLLLAALAEQQKIQVTDDEVEAKLKEIADQGGKHVAKVRAEYQGERRESLRNQVLQNKLLEYLVSQATITDAAPVAAPAENAGGPATEPAAAAAAETKPKAKRTKKAKAEKAAGEQAAGEQEDDE